MKREFAIKIRVTSFQRYNNFLHSELNTSYVDISSAFVSKTKRFPQVKTKKLFFRIEETLLNVSLINTNECFEDNADYYTNPILIVRNHGAKRKRVKREKGTRYHLNATCVPLSKWKMRKSKKLSSLTNVRVASQSKSLTVSKEAKTMHFYGKPSYMHLWRIFKVLCAQLYD